MNAFAKHAAILLAAMAAYQAGIARSDETFSVASSLAASLSSDGGQVKALGSDACAGAEQRGPYTLCSGQTPLVGPTGGSVSGQISGPYCDRTCGSCGDQTCEAGCGQGCGCGGSCWGCEDCPKLGIVGFAGLDSFKGVSDGHFESNFGAVTGLNAGTPIPGLADCGIGWQLGLSYGVYDVDGWGQEGVNHPHRNNCQNQVFVTTGFFHRARCDQRLSYGLVYDWMINTNWGEVVGNHPTMGQWRGQIEYTLSCCNAVGIWAAVRDRYGYQEIDDPYPITNRPISQVNLFWHHKFCTGTDTWLYFGIPQSDRLEGVYDNGGHSLGTWMIGGNVQWPMSDRLAFYANASYFRPSTSAGMIGAMETGYDIGVGVAWYFGGHALSHSINGRCWMPYMPMGNNSNFLVDQSEEY